MQVYPTTQAWIDARNPFSNKALWGLTLLERNLRQLSRLGITDVCIFISKKNDLPKFYRKLPKSLRVHFEFEDSGDYLGKLNRFLKKAVASRTLLLNGNALNDKRIVTSILKSNKQTGLVSPNNNPAAIAIVQAQYLDVDKDCNGLNELIEALIENSKLTPFEIDSIDSYMQNLRRTIKPLLLRIENNKQLKEADNYLRLTAHKGTNDFIAKYIHPPLEFGLTRLLAPTKITPNHITLLGIFLSCLTVYFFATGHLLTGVILAAIKGILDGVDGKLARLLLKYSKTGSLLDHVGDTIFDALWYLALGWHFSQGELSSTPATFTLILFFSYWLERIVPGLFKKLHGIEIYDYDEIDRFMRLIGSRINNNIWVMMVGILLGFPLQTFYVISIWMLLTALWHTVRLLYVTWTRDFTPAADVTDD